MVAVVQRVTQASVTAESQCIAKIALGLLVLLGIEKGDVRFMVEKILQLRIFADTQGHRNHSLQDINGELLLISLFILLANMTKGRRLRFEDPAPPEETRWYFQNMLEQFNGLGLAVQAGWPGLQ